MPSDMSIALGEPITYQIWYSDGMPQLHVVPEPEDGPMEGDLSSFTRSWRRSLKARNLSDKTVSTYLASAEDFGAYLAQTGGPSNLAEIAREHIESYIGE